MTPSTKWSDRACRLSAWRAAARLSVGGDCLACGNTVTAIASIRSDPICRVCPQGLGHQHGVRGSWALLRMFAVCGYPGCNLGGHTWLLLPGLVHCFWAWKLASVAACSSCPIVIVAVWTKPILRGQRHRVGRLTCVAGERLSYSVTHRFLLGSNNLHSCCKDSSNCACE